MLQFPRLYVCTSKNLQEQFAHDFPYARVLKGRANYPTDRFAKAFHPQQFGGHISCDDCTWTQDDGCKYCRQKSYCPYEIAKVQALRAELAVLNTSYLLAEANHAGKFSNPARLRKSGKGLEFVIADEADMLEEALMGYVSVEIGERRLKELRWEPPEKVTVPSSWEEWLDEHIDVIRQRVNSYPEIIDDIRIAREARYFDQLHEKMLGVRRGLDTGAWVYTGRGRKDDPGKGVSFKPSRVDFLGEQYLWRHSVRWLLMSATVISTSEMLDSLGYDGAYETVNVRNTFPVENRLVKVRPVVAMNNKNKEEARPKIADEVGRIMQEHSADRILVHTVSYDMTRYLHETLGSMAPDRDLFAYLFADDKARALDSYRKTAGGVLLAPSMDRGVDLPGDLCRVQVIVKCPFPYLGDRQVSARLHSRDGQTWYTVRTIRDIVQMCGRGVRSKDDHAVTYILDTHFRDKLWNQGRGLFPDWFVEAIVWR